MNRKKIMEKYKNLIQKPDIRPTSEIRYHHDNAPGTRYVFMDRKKCPESSIYTIVRDARNIDPQVPYVDPHIHNCASEFLFIGDNPDMTGLCAKVLLGDREFLVDSPASVFIPAGLEHSVQLVAGSGKFINIVCHADYNSSLAEKKVTIQHSIKA